MLEVYVLKFLDSIPSYKASTNLDKVAKLSPTFHVKFSDLTTSPKTPNSRPLEVCCPEFTTIEEYPVAPSKGTVTGMSLSTLLK